MKKTLTLMVVGIFGFVNLATYATTQTTSKKRVLSIPNTSIENVSVDSSSTQKPVVSSKPTLPPAMTVWGNTSPRPTVSTDEEQDRVDPYGPIYSNIKYSFDKSKVTSYYETNIPKMYRLKCDKSAILNKLWFSNENIFSLWLNEWNYQVSYDLNNCSAWMYTTQQPDMVAYEEKTVSAEYIMPYPYPTLDPIDEKTAISQAKQFISNNKVFDLIEKNLWDPIVRYRSYMDDSKTQLSNISILFPLIIDGKSVYYQYGDMAGISVEVNSNWVASANLSILSIILSRANSVVNGTDDIISMIQRWWNNMYYGDGMTNKETTVNLNNPEKVWLIVQRWNNYSSVPATYLVSGIKMRSDKSSYTDWPTYEMVISDYKIWNNNNYVLY